LACPIERVRIGNAKPFFATQSEFWTDPYLSIGMQTGSYVGPINADRAVSILVESNLAWMVSPKLSVSTLTANRDVYLDGRQRPVNLQRQ